MHCSVQEKPFIFGKHWVFLKFKCEVARLGEYHWHSKFKRLSTIIKYRRVRLKPTTRKNVHDFLLSETIINLNSKVSHSYLQEQVSNTKMAAFPPSQNNNPIEPSTDEQQESTLPPRNDDETLTAEHDSSPRMQVYQVVVPEGVKPNDHFTVMASNYRVVLKCPPVIGDGRQVRFKLPIRNTTTMSKSTNTITIRLPPNCKKNLQRVVI